MDAREAIYCTLLMSDSYLPGAMVLARSLRDHGTQAKIVALITPESLQAQTIEELKCVYDEVIPVSRVINVSPANLYLMDRPDLISTFTKIELWRQVQYKQIVYIDADVVALRAPDELLTLDTHFAAAPDIGWPDCFNSGVMVLRPSLQEYYSLLAFAQRGISFDGADQGLLNMHFTTWQRLSFAYNCTPSGHYQYIPAFRHFQSTISLVHYIGQNKPWNLPRQTFPIEGPYNQLLARWWSVYDRHYRPVAPVAPVTQPVPAKLDHVSAKQERSLPATTEYAGSPGQPVSIPSTSSLGPPVARDVSRSAVPSAIPLSEGAMGLAGLQSDYKAQAPAVDTHDVLLTNREITLSAVPQHVRGEEDVSIPRCSFPLASQPAAEDLGGGSGTIHQPTAHRFTTLSPVVEPPTQSQQPLLQATQGFATIKDSVSEPVDTKGKKPASYGTPQAKRAVSPPLMTWDAARAPPPVDSKPEAANFPTQTYTMSKSRNLFQPPKSYPEAPKDMYYELPPKAPIPGAATQIFPWETQAPEPSRVFFDEMEDTTEANYLGTTGHLKANERFSMDTELDASQMSTNYWDTYVRSNAWDEVPEIEQYIRSVQKPRQGSVQVLSGGIPGGRKSSLRLTDFPTEIERPSLPVTPAPIRRQSYGHDEDQGDLLGAEGVPKQEEWNPVEQLERLHQHHCEFLDRALRDIPKEEAG
ncbi:hypothetical protein UREG_02029 [Uncinocarpus reesii 1704]|uniref:glycogenin glucosyltransferase n=1 Tax=Uncinocarpus reesii (strain UAMH 1704) TaxID=336963 RepID=C4JK72_UNCRE|nr:uncharacterized protein UREG_02029 [Uncinocarpus reesii 1704]EEP77180.1 hypothetical protein UREG_02029 [Uncinocarpus reesii 1704]